MSCGLKAAQIDFNTTPHGYFQCIEIRGDYEYFNCLLPQPQVTQIKLLKLNAI